MSKKQPRIYWKKLTNIETERDTTERYRADWRAVCNALNTSPDSPVAIVLAKIKTLQDAAAIRARNGAASTNMTIDTVAVQAEREACAQVAEQESLHEPLVSDEWNKRSRDHDERVAFTHADHIAVAIRARGNGRK